MALMTDTGCGTSPSSIRASHRPHSIGDLVKDIISEQKFIFSTRALHCR